MMLINPVQCDGTEGKERGHRHTVAKLSACACAELPALNKVLNLK